MTIKKIILPIFLSVGTIFAFIFSIIKPDFNSPKISSSDKKTNLSTTDDLKPIISSNPQQFQKLSVLPLRCIGCGKCARIDSAHFEINPTTGKAIVVSSINLNSQNLTAAINVCPVQAITLN